MHETAAETHRERPNSSATQNRPHDSQPTIDFDSKSLQNQTIHHLHTHHHHQCLQSEDAALPRAMPNQIEETWRKKAFASFVAMTSAIQIAIQTNTCNWAASTPRAPCWRLVPSTRQDDSTHFQPQQYRRSNCFRSSTRRVSIGETNPRRIERVAHRRRGSLEDSPNRSTDEQDVNRVDTSAKEKKKKKNKTKAMNRPMMSSLKPTRQQ